MTLFSLFTYFLFAIFKCSLYILRIFDLQFGFLRWITAHMLWMYSYIKYIFPAQKESSIEESCERLILYVCTSTACCSCSSSWYSRPCKVVPSSLDSPLPLARVPSLFLYDSMFTTHTESWIHYRRTHIHIYKHRYTNEVTRTHASDDGMRPQLSIAQLAFSAAYLI